MAKHREPSHDEFMKDVAQIMSTTGCSRATAYRIRRSYLDRIEVFSSQIRFVARRLQFDSKEPAHA